MNKSNMYTGPAGEALAAAADATARFMRARRDLRALPLWRFRARRELRAEVERAHAEALRLVHLSEQLDGDGL